ncbi:MAG: hypothetical protein U9R00_01565 [Patescibacteria group bacterium]|nr:hypothetical protein [Patescibacteria group bacterium]
MKEVFHAYDIRGKVPEDINPDFAFKLAKAVATVLKPTNIVVARDNRNSSEELSEAIIKSLRSVGVSVVDIGLASTPQFYFSLITSYADGGIMITASHNPKEFNGFKICGPKAEAIFSENKLPEIKKVFEEENFIEESDRKGKLMSESINEKYETHFTKKYRSLSRKFKVLVDTGNSLGIIDTNILKKIFGDNLEIDILFEELNGDFPYHDANPVIPKNMDVLMTRLEDKKKDYDLGFAFDGDGDRVVFFLTGGKMIPPDLITALIGENIAQKGDLVAYEVRTSRLVENYLKEKGIITKKYRAGSAFMKQYAKKDNAVFVGEKSGHYIYKSTNYTDSPLLTIILILELIDKKNKSLNELVEPLMTSSTIPETNYKVDDSDKIINLIKKEFSEDKIEEIDGLSVYSEKYFFNIRKSNTEELIRLNLEADSDDIVNTILEKINSIIKSDEE